MLRPRSGFDPKKCIGIWIDPSAETFAKYDALYKPKSPCCLHKTQVKNALKAYAEEKTQEVGAQHTLRKPKSNCW